MNKGTSLAITFLVLLIIGFGFYSFYLNYEYKETTVYTGKKGEARKNPFYATRLFLKRMGIPAETLTSVQGLSSLPNTDTVIIITTNRTTLSPERTEKLIEWVKSGGHLITLATRNWKYNGKEDNFEDDEDGEKHISPDPLQRFMGVYTTSRIHRNYREDEDEDEDTEKDKELSSILLGNSDKKLKVDINYYRPILLNDKHKEQTQQIKLGLHNFIVQQKIGKGMVTLVSDMDFIQNNTIKSGDHAEILWLLVHSQHKALAQPELVWLIHNDKMPPLWSLLWNKFWALIVSLSILLFFWLFKGAQRFGPMIPKLDENRRSLNEHINSSGYFYWKNNKKQKLIEGSRKALTQRLSRIYPGWDQRNKEEQIKILVKQLSIKPEAVEQLLYSDNIEQADEFTQLIKQLETIRTTI